MTDYPTGIDDNTTLPNPTSGAFTNDPDHAGMHSTENDAIKALETKLGTGASTSAISTVLRAAVAGSSVWGKLVLTSDVTGVLPAANGGTGVSSLGSGVATFLGTPSSANLAAALTDETGTGAAVFANTPALVTPNIGVATGTSLTLGGIAVPTISSTSTLTGKSMDGGSNTFANIPASAIVTGAWQAWTPSFTNWTIGTGGSAGTVANYVQIGKFVSFYLVTTLGTSGASVGSGVSFTLPVAATTTATAANFGLVSTITTGVIYNGFIQLLSGKASVSIGLTNATFLQSASVTSTQPATWAAGDSMRITGRYEAL